MKVFDRTDWMSKDFQRDANFNKGIVPGHYTVRYEKDGKQYTVDGGDEKGTYPLDLMKKLKADGGQKIQTFGPGELKKK